MARSQVGLAFCRFPWLPDATKRIASRRGKFRIRLGYRGQCGQQSRSQDEFATNDDRSGQTVTKQAAISLRLAKLSPAPAQLLRAESAGDASCRGRPCQLRCARTT